MQNSEILEVISKIHQICKFSLTGPDCVDRQICDGACCRTSPDIPPVLATRLVNLGLAQEEDFVPSDFLPFRVRITADTSRCALFDPGINGCKVHFTPLKPPQCWVYPLQLDDNFHTPHPSHILYTPNISHTCRKGYQFFVDPQKLGGIRELLECYKDLTLDDVKKYQSHDSISRRVQSNLRPQLSDLSISSFLGVRVTVTGFKLLRSSGTNFLWADFCTLFKCETDYSCCRSPCPKIQDTICDLVINLLHLGYQSPVSVNEIIFTHEILSQYFSEFS